jgi:hypothetical protein
MLLHFAAANAWLPLKPAALGICCNASWSLKQCHHYNSLPLCPCFGLCSLLQNKHSAVQCTAGSQPQATLANNGGSYPSITINQRTWKPTEVHCKTVEESVVAQSVECFATCNAEFAADKLKTGDETTISCKNITYHITTGKCVNVQKPESPN